MLLETFRVLMLGAVWVFLIAASSFYQRKRIGGVQLATRDLVDLALKCSMIPENLLAVHPVNLAVRVENILSSGTTFSWSITGQL
jgi:hypothetical protein